MSSAHEEPTSTKSAVASITGGSLGATADDAALPANTGMDPISRRSPCEHGGLCSLAYDKVHVEPTTVATLTTREHAFRTSVNLHEVECLLLAWHPRHDRDSETKLDLSECRNVDRGADVRLTNAMRRWSAGRLVVTLAADLDMNSHAWFQLFTRSGLGRAIALHADAVLSGTRDVRSALREYHLGGRDTYASNCVMFTDLQSGALVPSIERFTRTVESALACHLARAHAALEHADLESLIRLAHEAVTNVVDHAFNGPWRHQGVPMSYLSLRWYKTISAKTDEMGGLRGYLDAQRAYSDPVQPLLGWLEVVVADDGIGVAARHHQVDEDSMYTGALTVEDAALLDAISASGTVKLRSLDCEIRGDPGHGTTIILKRLKALSAYSALRTGRRLIEFDPYRHDTFEPRSDVLGWMPGTAVQALVPIRDPQLRLT